MQRAELGLELLFLPFQLLALPPFLIELALELFQLRFVFALGAADLLIAFKDPARGQSFQIRAPLPVRAMEFWRQVPKLWPDQSGGGNWSSRQLVSDRRCRSLRTLR